MRFWLQNNILYLYIYQYRHTQCVISRVECQIAIIIIIIIIIIINSIIVKKRVQYYFLSIVSIGGLFKSYSQIFVNTVQCITWVNNLSPSHTVCRVYCKLAVTYTLLNIHEKCIDFWNGRTNGYLQWVVCWVERLMCVCKREELLCRICCGQVLFKLCQCNADHFSRAECYVNVTLTLVWYYWGRHVVMVWCVVLAVLALVDGLISLCMTTLQDCIHTGTTPLLLFCSVIGTTLEWCKEIKLFVLQFTLRLWPRSSNTDNNKFQNDNLQK